MSHLWELTKWHSTALRCSSGHCCSHVRSDSMSTVIKIMHKLCVRNQRTEHLLCTLWHHSCLRALNTARVVNPSARIGLTKTNTQSLITIITHYTRRGQPPALSSSITSPLAYEAHRWSSSNVWISMWRKVEQVWYLKSISAGIMNMVISSARRQAGKQAGRQAAHADVTPRGAQSKWGVPGRYTAVSSGSRNNSTAPLYLQSITPLSAGGISGG